jgi:hypothetical protein
MTPLKLFIISSLILTVIALVVVYGAIQYASSVHPATMTVVPYVDVESVNVTGGGLIIKLVVVNSTGNLTVTGGYAEIIGTGQSSPLRVVGPLTLEGTYTLLPQYVSMSTIGIRGLVSGTFYGDPMYIGFYLVAPIHVVINVGVGDVTYSNCLLNLTLTYSTPIPILINGATNVTLVDDSESQFVFFMIGNLPLHVLLMPGVNATSIMINAEELPNVHVFQCSLVSGHTYTLYLPITVTYIYPTTNVTAQLTLYRVFTVGG